MMLSMSLRRDRILNAFARRMNSDDDAGVAIAISRPVLHTVPHRMASLVMPRALTSRLSKIARIWDDCDGGKDISRCGVRGVAGSDHRAWLEFSFRAGLACRAPLGWVKQGKHDENVPHVESYPGRDLQFLAWEGCSA